MPNGLDAYFRAKGQAMQQGQNMLAAEQQLRGVQREQGLRDIISGAYDPDEGMSMQNALSAMYEGGYGPEAMKIEAAQARLRGATPSSVNEFRFFEQLPQADKEKFMRLKRAQKYLDVGEGFVAPSQISPAIAPTPVVTRKLKPTETPEYKQRVAEETKIGAELGGEKALLANLEASLPGLKNVTEKLSRLGKVATFTKAGLAADAAARQFGGTTKGAVARADYIATVSNEVLPLLKQTFGAAFTEKEGEALKATLGDPDSSPEEKDAQLNSFIEAKIRQIAAKKRRVGAIPAAPDINAQALKWANENPNDPRALQILKRLGR